MEPGVRRAEKSRREHKTLIFFLVALEALAVALLIAGLALGNDSLKVASYALGNAGHLRAARQYRALSELVR